MGVPARKCNESDRKKRKRCPDRNLLGGYLFDSSSLNTLAKRSYSFGTSLFVVYCCACIASSVAVVFIEHCDSSTATISSFSLLVCAMIDFWVVQGFMDRSTTGSAVSSMVAYFQLNLGLYAANQGYPMTTSSHPMLVMRNLMSLWTPC